jgi:hypothetical protein
MTQQQPLFRFDAGSQTTAANDDRVANQSRSPASGWDPFEIWRLRVRDARRSSPTKPVPRDA